MHSNQELTEFHEYVSSEIMFSNIKKLTDLCPDVKSDFIFSNQKFTEAPEESNKSYVLMKN
jgi:hypothetical protein